MAFVAATPTDGELLHAFGTGDHQLPEVDGRVLAKALCGLRRGVGFVLTGDQFEDVLERRHCVRCVRAIALSRAVSDDERDDIQRAYREGTLRLAS